MKTYCEILRKMISRFLYINWSSRSTDLTAPDIYLWGYLKEKCYANKPQSIADLKNNITEIRSLQPQTLRAVMENAS